ncbi:MAG: FAS1-like dehydratase domain-containing protein, partial [Candidatus Rokuibacteriota bacterium]
MTAIDAAIVGAEVPPLPQRVDARWLMAYAAGLGENDPRCYDTLARTGPLGHPLFAVCYEWPALVALRDKTVAAALAPLSVHATHRLLIHRAPRADETLLTTARLVGVERRRAGVLVTARVTTVDGHGAPVTTTDYGSVYRGVALVGD